MFGALATFVSERISTTVKRYALIYGLMGLAGLLLVYAAAFGVHTIYLLLMVRYGAVAAHLIMAGGLLILAAAVLAAAFGLRNRRPPGLADTLHTPPFLAYPRNRRRAVIALAGSGAAAAVAVGALFAALGRGFNS